MNTIDIELRKRVNGVEATVAFSVAPEVLPFYAPGTDDACLSFVGVPDDLRLAMTKRVAMAMQRLLDAALPQLEIELLQASAEFLRAAAVAGAQRSSGSAA